MGENNLANNNGEISIFTVKNILKFLLLLCIIFVFCPSFLVSCSGQNINVSVMTAVSGVSIYGEQLVEPYPAMLIYFILPIAMLSTLFIKKFADRNAAFITLVCSVIDFIIWLVFRSSVKRMAEENYCSFKTTVWFIFNIIALVLIIFLSLIVVIKRIQLNTDLISLFSETNPRGIGNQNPNSYNNPNHYNNPRNNYNNAHENNYNKQNYGNPTPAQVPTVPYSPPGALEFISGELQGTTIPLQNQDSIIIGRDPSVANIILNNKDISRRHCEIQYSPSDRCYYICDYSSYGLRINGQQVQKNVPVHCNSGSKISLANGRNEFILK